MMRLLPMKGSGERRGEPVISLFFGVPSLAIALGALVLLVSYHLVGPVGPTRFYQFELGGIVGVEGSGQVVHAAAEYIVPSVELVEMLLVGMVCGCLGIALSRRRGPDRRVTLSAAGAIACAIALVLAWLLVVRAALA